MRARSLAGALLALAGARAGAQTVTVTTDTIPGDTLVSVTPTFVVATDGFNSPPAARALRLQVATTPAFTRLLVDTTVFGDTVTVAVPELMPHARPIAFRATASAPGENAISPIYQATSAPWVRLIFPNAPGGITFANRRPTFVWSSPPPPAGRGPWVYDLAVTGSGNPRPVLTHLTTDTTFAPPFDLETSTSYRWSVLVSLTGGDSVRVASISSFVILDPSVPPVTLLYQNFPNPFPQGAQRTTCVWFDLAQDANVKLEIYDIRGHLVRSLIPPGTRLQAGRYGRLPGGSGCDPLFAWDGRDAGGDIVHSGIYLLRLRGAGADAVRKIVFRGL